MSRILGSKKSGGRVKGTPNKRTLDLLDRIQELDWDPLQELYLLISDPEVSKSEKILINKEMLQYLYPKRKAIDLDASATVQTWAELVTASMQH